jgi:hypothetical protein
MTEKPNKSQTEKFKQAARALECDDDPGPLQGAARETGEA